MGTGASFNVKNLFPNDYANFTDTNFIVEPYVIYGKTYTELGSNPVYAGPVLNTNELNYSKSYNASTGVLSVTYGGSIYGGAKYGGDNNAGYIHTHNISTSFKAYLVLSDIETA